jgi:SET domain-containing protein
MRVSVSTKTPPDRFPRVFEAECDVGRGLFAAEPIAAGTDILWFVGPVLTLAEVRAKGSAAANALQIEANLYLDLQEPGRLVNHSCDPNSGVFDGVRLVALRNLIPGEEVRFDYSTTVADGWTMRCACRSSHCRGVVRAFLTLPESRRTWYAVRGCVLPCLLDNLGA